MLEVTVVRIPGLQLQVSSGRTRRQDLRRSSRPDVVASWRRHLERTAPVALHLAPGVQRCPLLALWVVAPAAVTRCVVAGGNGGVVVGGKCVAGAEGVAVNDGLAMVVA